MFFLLRTCFWLSLVALLLPEGALTTWPQTVAEQHEDKTRAYHLAGLVGGPGDQNLAQYLATQTILICDEYPGFCSVGDATIHFVHVQAANASGILYGWLLERAQDTTVGTPLGDKPMFRP